MAKLILFNKPFQVLCQFSSPDQRATLKDYIHLPNVYPAGRLDYDSEGLLLLTDSGSLQARIAHPDFKMKKTYWVQVEGQPTEDALQALRDGIKLKDGPTRPACVRMIPPPDIWPRTPPIRQRENDVTQWLEIIISEGRNRQVRRMTAHIGYPTLRLVRAAIGEWSLTNIAPGNYRELTVHMPESSKKQSKTRGHQKPAPRHKPKRPSS